MPHVVWRGAHEEVQVEEAPDGPVHQCGAGGQLPLLWTQAEDKIEILFVK